MYVSFLGSPKHGHIKCVLVGLEQNVGSTSTGIHSITPTSTMLLDKCITLLRLASKVAFSPPSQRERFEEETPVKCNVCVFLFGGYVMYVSFCLADM